MTHESYELKLFELSKIAKSVLEGKDDTQKVHFTTTVLNLFKDSLGRETLIDFIKDDGKFKVTDLPNEVLIQILRYLPTRDFRFTKFEMRFCPSKVIWQSRYKCSKFLQNSAMSDISFFDTCLPGSPCILRTSNFSQNLSVRDTKLYGKR